MTNTEAIKILNALRRLDGVQTEKSSTPYRLASTTIYAVAKNIRKLSTLQEDLVNAQNKLLKNYLKEGELGIPAGDSRIEAYSTELKKIYDQEADFTPHRFTYASLNAEENRIPPTVIEGLLPILDEEPAPTSPGGNGGVPAAK